MYSHQKALVSSHYIDLLAKFDSMIVAKGYRQTGRTYQLNVREFLLYLESKGECDIQALDSLALKAYYKYLLVRPAKVGIGSLKPSTIAGKMHSIRLFLDFILDLGVISYSITLPSMERTISIPRTVLSHLEVKMLFDSCENYRDRAILALAYGCGLRRSEINELDVGDFSLSRKELIVRNGKNSKRREIPVAEFVCSILKNYLFEERIEYCYFNNSRTNAFLLANNGKRMRGANVNSRLKYLLQKTGNFQLCSKNISLHSLRHSITTHLLESGATFDFVRNFLGHSEIDTVHVYARRRRFNLAKNKLS
ncbi:MAG: hypothetical protein RL092_674 [Bacteroidota bacterium]|jgi:site-specific recombinase XerD